MEQPAFSFDRDPLEIAVPACAGSRTSRQAAEQLKARRVQGKKMARCLIAYRHAGASGLTAGELQTATGLLTQSICSLRHAAVDRQWLVAMGERPGPHGADQTAHRLTAVGARELEAWERRRGDGR